ncbi:Gfo/Idh/MocA family protein [Actinoalloteichus caeruleus]|uniref:Gfo/Idh/MocA family protein n=1 Tax=Actinoalloteichus cyanogriseus TaxID=2893586 RepID=UPI00068FEC26|nr:Gfo/Idh/MocA family oxidoreductase [Actinoalloteichus caeruleus]
MTGGSFRTVDHHGPLRAVVVGAGAMGRAWLNTVDASPTVDLVGVVDLDPNAATAALSACGAPPVPVSTSLSALAEATRPDLVIDVTVPSAHYSVTREALDLGLAVLGEKPLAATLAEAVSLVVAAERAGCLFAVSQNRRHSPGLAALRRQAGTLGAVGVVSTEFFRAPRFGGFREEMEHPLLLDMAIHPFDAARYLVGGDPVTVWCEEFNPRWSWYRGDAAATAIFEMTGGVRYLYTGSWCAPGLETSWNGRWRVSGRHGAAVWDGEGEPVVEHAVPVAGAAEAAAESRARGWGSPSPVDIAGSLADFEHALRTGLPSSTVAADNLLSLAMVHGAIASAATGTRVLIADLLAEAHRVAVDGADQALRPALRAWRPPALGGAGGGSGVGEGTGA